MSGSFELNSRDPSPFNCLKIVTDDDRTYVIDSNSEAIPALLEDELYEATDEFQESVESVLTIPGAVAIHRVRESSQRYVCPPLECETVEGCPCSIVTPQSEILDMTTDSLPPYGEGGVGVDGMDAMLPVRRSYTDVVNHRFMIAPMGMVGEDYVAVYIGQPDREDPEITMTSPEDGAVFTNWSPGMSAVAEVSDNVGVASVEFQYRSVSQEGDGSEHLGWGRPEFLSPLADDYSWMGMVAPMGFRMSGGMIGVGAWKVRAKATDLAGNTAYSDWANINIRIEMNPPLRVNPNIE